MDREKLTEEIMFLTNQGWLKRGRQLGTNTQRTLELMCKEVKDGKERKI